MKPVVFLPEPIAPDGLDLLRAACDCLIPWEEGYAGPPGRFGLYEADAVVIRLFAVSAQDMEQANQLKVIGKHGVGVDSVDCEAATARRIPIVYTPTANANAVAEHTLTLMLALARRIGPAAAAMQEGNFGMRDALGGVELAGKSLAVVGLGRIGARVAQMAALGLGMTVYGYDPFLDKTAYSGPAILLDTLEELLPKADFLTLHAPLTPATQHLINADTLELLNPTCHLINTSRGAAIDEMALADALSDGRIAGAALDVFSAEPLPIDHPLYRTPNTLLTPHLAGLTQESIERMSLHVAQGILDVLQGRTPEYIFNPEALD